MPAVSAVRLAQEMLENWGKVLPELMQKWSLDRAELVQLFGTTRDEWIESDLPGWLAPNRIYDGVADAVKSALSSDHAYIVTTKQVSGWHLSLAASFPAAAHATKHAVHPDKPAQQRVTLNADLLAAVYSSYGNVLQSILQENSRLHEVS